MSVENVISFGGAPIPEGAVINKDVIELLDLMKEKALRGEISMLAVAYLDGAHKACNNWSSGDRRLSLIAAVEFLKRDLMNAEGD